MSTPHKNTVFQRRFINSISAELVTIGLLLLLPVVSTVETALFKNIQILVVLALSIAGALRLIAEERISILWHDVLAIGFLLLTILYTYTSPTISSDFITSTGNLVLFLIVSVAFYQYYKYVFTGFVLSELSYVVVMTTQAGGRLYLLGMSPQGIALLSGIAAPFVVSFAFQDGFFTTKSAAGSSGLIAILYMGQQTGTRTFLFVLPLLLAIIVVGNIRLTPARIFGIVFGTTSASVAVSRIIASPLQGRLSINAVLYGLSDRLDAYRPIIANIDRLALTGVGYSPSPEIINEIGPHNMFLTSVLRFGLVSTVLLFGLVLLLFRDCFRLISHRREKNAFILAGCGALLVYVAQLQFHHGLTWDGGWIFIAAVVGMIKAELVSERIQEGS